VCRSIKTLRPPYTDTVTVADVEAAALQYVRKVAGMRQPSARNKAAFDAAVQAVSNATEVLLREVTVRTPTASPDRLAASPPASPAAPAACRPDFPG
jgi:hypothetical protein